MASVPLQSFDISQPILAGQRAKANRLAMQGEEERRIDKKALRGLRQQAFSGDQSAIGRIGVIDPATAAQTQKILEGISVMSDNKKAVSWAKTPEQWDQGKVMLKDIGVDLNIGEFDPNNVAYLAGFAKEVMKITGDAKSDEVQSSKILPGGVTQIVTKGGQTSVIQPSEEELALIKRGEDRGVDLQQQRAQGRNLGKDAAKLASTALDRTEKLRSNNLKLRKVISEIKDGAETGPLSNMLPSFRASTKRLIQIKNELGLDVVGSVTFGALSEGELNLAMDTALPTGLQGPELVKWATDKINAQEKLADYLEDQAIYLSKPGNNAAKWAEMGKKKREEKGAQPNIGRFTVEVVQ